MSHAGFAVRAILAGAVAWTAVAAHPQARSPQVSAGPTAGIAGPPGSVTTGANATGAITGVVTDAATGAPIGGAVVTVASASGPVRTQTRQVTDAKGRFGFVNLPARDYTVSASHARYFESSYGRDIGTVAARPIAIADGQWFDGARIGMWPAGAISGVVADERGEPVAGVFVRALVEIQIAGHTQLATGPLTTTDDRGAYRIGNLMPGKYLVQVPSVQASAPATMDGLALAGYTAQAALAMQAAGRSIRAELGVTTDPLAQLLVGRYATPPPPQGGRWLAYPITYHPDASSVSQALTIELKRGESRAGADIRLQPVATSRLAGFVQGPAEALSRLTLRLLPVGLEDLGVGSESATTLVGADGRFVFLGVPAGSYTIDAPQSTSEFTMARFSLGQFTPSLPRPPGSNGGSMSSNSVDSAGPGVSFLSQDSRGGSGGTGYGARLPITVDGRDRLDLTVPMRPLGTMNGRIILERDPKAPDAVDPNYIVTALEPANGSARLGVLRSGAGPNQPRDQFAISGLQAGAYLLRATMPKPWILKSVQWNGKDYTNIGFDATAAADFSNVTLTVTNQSANIFGTARDDRGAAADAAAIIAFPAEAAGWVDYGLTPLRIRTVLTGQGGEFKLTSLPAGDYNLIAVDPADIDAWRDPAFLNRAAGAAVRVHVGWGETATQELRVKAVR